MAEVQHSVLTGDDLHEPKAHTHQNADLPGVWGEPSAAFVRGTSGGQNATNSTLTLGAAPAQGNVLVAMAQFQGNNQWPMVTKIAQTGVAWAMAYRMPRPNYQYSLASEIWIGYVGAGAGTQATLTWEISNWHNWALMEFSGIAGRLLFGNGWSGASDGTAGPVALLAAPFVPSGGHLLVYKGFGNNGTTGGSLLGGLTQVSSGAGYRIGPASGNRVGYTHVGASGLAFGSMLAVLG